MKTHLTTWQYAIIMAALQAQKELRHRNLTDDRRIRQNLTLLRLGREVYRRLQGQGVKLPQIDLADPVAAAAAPAHVESRKAAAGYVPDQDGAGQA